MGSSHSVEQEQAEAAKLTESFLLAFQSRYIQTYSTVVIARKSAVGALQPTHSGPSSCAASNYGATSGASGGGGGGGGDPTSNVLNETSSEVAEASIQRQRTNTTIQRVSFAAADASSPDASFKARRGTMMSAASANTTASSATMPTVTSPNLLAGVPLDVGQHSIEFNMPYDSRNYWVKKKESLLLEKRKSSRMFSSSAAAYNNGDDDGDRDENADTLHSPHAARHHHHHQQQQHHHQSPLSICPDVLDFAVSNNIHASYRHKGMLLCLSQYMRQYKASYIALHRDWHASLWEWEEQFLAGDQPVKRIDLSQFADGGILCDATDAAADRMKDATSMMGISWEAAPSSELYPPRTVELFEKRRHAAASEQLVLQFGARSEYWRHWVKWLEQAAALASPYKIQDDAAHAIAFRHAIDRAYNDVWRIYKPAKHQLASHFGESIAAFGAGGGGHQHNNNSRQGSTSPPEESSRFFGRSSQAFGGASRSNYADGHDGNDNDDDDNNNPFSSNHNNHNNPLGMGDGSDVPPFPRHGGGELCMLSTALFKLLHKTVVVKFVAKKAEELAKTTKQQKDRLTERERQREEAEAAQHAEDQRQRELLGFVVPPADGQQQQQQQQQQQHSKMRRRTSGGAGMMTESNSAGYSQQQDDSEQHNNNNNNNNNGNLAAAAAVDNFRIQHAKDQLDRKEEKARRRKADTEWTALKPYLDKLEQVICDEAQRGVTIAWNTTMELVKKRNVRLDCAAATEAVQAGVVWRSAQDRAANALGQCPHLTGATNLIKKMLCTSISLLCGTFDEDDDDDDDQKKNQQQQQQQQQQRAEEEAAKRQSGRRPSTFESTGSESFVMLLMRQVNAAFAVLPEALDDVIAQSTLYTPFSPGASMMAGERGEHQLDETKKMDHTGFASISIRSDGDVSATDVLNMTATMSSSQGGGGGGSSSSGGGGGGGAGAGAGGSGTVSATARKGSLMHSLMTRGFPKPFLIAQEALLCSATSSIIDALRAALQEEFTERASEFLVSDSRCRATAAEWARRRENPYLSYSVAGRALRLHSLLFSDACYTFDLLTLQQQSSSSSSSSSSPLFGNKGEASVVRNVKNRLDYTTQRHVRETVAQMLYSVCAVYWEATVVRWLQRFCADDTDHFGSVDLHVDMLEGESLCPNYAVEDTAYAELLQVCRDAVNECIADTI